jgi:hypothetical protein
MTDYSPAAERPALHATTIAFENISRAIALNRISWGGVLAGVFMALVVQLLLNMLGIGIGVATLDPGTNDNPSPAAFSVAAGVWYVVAGIVASYAGGYVAGRLSGRPVASTAAFHGLTSWAVTTLVVFYLLTTALGGIIGGAFSGLSGAMGGLGRAAGSVAQVAAPSVANATDPMGAIERQLREASGGDDPAALRDAAVSAVKAALAGDQAQAQDARERAAQALAKTQNISVEEARAKVGQYEQQYRQATEKAKQQAVEAAQMTTKVVSRGALVGFFALVLGAVAAWFGGRSGTVMTTETDLQLVVPTQRRP